MAVINPRGINAIKNNQIRRRLREQGRADDGGARTRWPSAPSAEGKLKGFESLLDGPSAVVYGKASISHDRPAAAGREEGRREARAARRLLRRRGLRRRRRASSRSASCRRAKRRSGRSSPRCSGPGQKLAGALKGQAGKIGGDPQERSKRRPRRRKPPPRLPLRRSGSGCRGRPGAGAERGDLRAAAVTLRAERSRAKRRTIRRLRLPRKG